MTLIDELDYYEQVDRRIFEDEFADWLPDEIFDIHAHSWLPEHLYKSIAEERVGLVFEAESVTWEELENAYALLFPGKRVSFNVFGMPLTVVNREANNAYIAEHIDNKTRFGFYVPGLDDSAEGLSRQILSGGFVGLKPYLAYVTWKELEEIRIIDFLCPAHLEVANAFGLPVMLHVPRNKRLADPDNLHDLEHIAANYPNAKIILAHGGRAYSRDLIDRALDVVAALPNIYFDFSNVQSIEVVQAILERMPLSHLMYGSDIPVATVRGLLFMMNGQRVCITRKRFPWSISSDKPGELRCTFMGYEQIRAMKRACELTGIDAAGVRALFYDNANQLVQSALQNLQQTSHD